MAIPPIMPAPSIAGHIAAVGYEFYIEMLEQAIQTLKGESIEEEWEPEVRVRAAALIPEAYVPDPGLRLSLYKRLASTSDEDRLADLREELRDRFGPVPEPLQHLFLIIALKLKLKQLGIQKLEISDRELGLVLSPRGPWKVERLVALIKKEPRVYQLRGEGKLAVTLKEEGRGLESAEGVLTRLDLLLA